MLLHRVTYCADKVSIRSANLQRLGQPVAGQWFRRKGIGVQVQEYRCQGKKGLGTREYMCQGKEGLGTREYMCQGKEGYKYKSTGARGRRV